METTTNTQNEMKKISMSNFIQSRRNDRGGFKGVKLNKPFGKNKETEIVDMKIFNDEVIIYTPSYKTFKNINKVMNYLEVQY